MRSALVDRSGTGCSAPGNKVYTGQSGARDGYPLCDDELIAAPGNDEAPFAVFCRCHYGLRTDCRILRRRLDRSLADELAAATFLHALDGRDGDHRARRDALDPRRAP